MRLERSWFDFVVWGLYSSNKTVKEEVDIDVVGNKEFISYIRGMFEHRYGQSFCCASDNKIKVPVLGTFTFIEDESVKGFQFNIKE